ncbi:mechanosensitive ion channel protein 2, chloroplastic-like isoform X3 [Salvia splendens]|uniref:mechanosensitive ion channel protein 2, chloroplastic-like isoform X3 n=1 Tax=Salvia splendens TaxID=180675 RepID=UPI001C26A6B2|nr:mechanosensitive ion channel protein 2, chloroplastic-like isoform X3 [Salvia splendens]
MDIFSSLQLSLELGIRSNYETKTRFRLQNSESRGKFCVLRANLSSFSAEQCGWSRDLSKRIKRGACVISSRNHRLKCHCFLNRVPSFDAANIKNATSTLARSLNQLPGNPHVIKLASAVGFVIFAIWGLRPLVRQCRNIFFGKSDSSWRRSSTFHVTASYIQPLLLWAGAIYICRALDPMILPSEAGQIVKKRVLNFVRSLSTVLAFAYLFSSVFQQAQKFFMETNEFTDASNMGFQFVGRTVYTAVWVAAVSLFMELLGFSTQRWITAGGFGTVLITLAGREIFTNFLSSVMIHTTRPFVLNEWIQTKIQGSEVSGTVEHVGWWSPTIIRADDREAVHIPNHKFTMNIVRNLSQKTHWRIKTHLAISHLDVGKVNKIVADMRKVLSKNPQVEQQKLHRRVFLDNIDPENQALLILVSCFVKTSRFEEYLCVKEAILLDLLRVISHHRARLATPIRTLQKVYRDADLDDIPFSDSPFSWGATSKHPLLLVEPSNKIDGGDKIKPHVRSTHINGEEDEKATPRSTQSAADGKEDDTKGENIDTKPKETEVGDHSRKEAQTTEAKVGEESGRGTKEVKSSPWDTNKLGNAATKAPNSEEKLLEGVPSTSQVKQDARQQATQAPPPTKPSSLEENIVLGVALDGSKRTLPIDEDTNPEDMKELARLHSGSGPAVTHMEKKDTKQSNTTGSPSSDQKDQQD